MARLTWPTSGRAWAYGALLLGGLVSIAANVAHSYVPAPGSPENWSPPAGAVLGATFWPLALFLAIEVLARVDWPSRWWWVAVRWLGLVPVAAVAALVSYRHLSGLLAHYGEDSLTYRFGPLAVDGLMVMATGALLATRPRGHAVRDIEETSADSAPDTAPVPAAPPVPDSTPAPADRPVPDRTRTARPSAKRPVLAAVPDGDPLLPVARQIAKALTAGGQNLTRSALHAGIKEAGHRCGTDRAVKLYAEITSAGKEGVDAQLPAQAGS